MKLFVLGFSLILGVSAHAEMGFYKRDDARFPAPVRKAADSVFKIVVPSSHDYDVYYREDYNTAAFKQMHRHAIDDKQLIIVGQLNFCVDTNIPVCLVYKDIAISTAFAVLDEYHLATNRHADEFYLINLYKELKKIGYSDNEALDIFRQYPLPMKILKDKESLKNIGTKHVEFARWFNAIPPLLKGHEGIDYVSTDIMIIRTDKPLGYSPLPIAAKPLTVGETFFVVGYPSLTTNRQKDHNVPDSNGIWEISISSGTMSSVDRGFERIAFLGSSIRETREEIKTDKSLQAKWDRMIFGDADSDHGGSGSPYLNAQGEVVGLHSTGLIEYRGSLPGLAVSLGLAWSLKATPKDDFDLLPF